MGFTIDNYINNHITTDYTTKGGKNQAGPTTELTAQMQGTTAAIGKQTKSYKLNNQAMASGAWNLGAIKDSISGATDKTINGLVPALSGINKPMQKLTTNNNQLGSAVNKTTKNWRSMRFEWLGVMFAGMALTRAVQNMTAPALEAAGVFDIMNTILELAFLPTAISLIDPLVGILDATANLSPEMSGLLGIFAGITGGLGMLMSFSGQAVMGLMSLAMALGVPIPPGSGLSGMAEVLTGTLGKLTEPLGKVWGFLSEWGGKTTTTTLDFITTGIGYAGGGGTGTGILGGIQSILNKLGIPALASGISSKITLTFDAITTGAITGINALFASFPLWLRTAMLGATFTAGAVAAVVTLTFLILYKFFEDNPMESQKTLLAGIQGRVEAIKLANWNRRPGDLGYQTLESDPMYQMFRNNLKSLWLQNPSIAPIESSNYNRGTPYVYNPTINITTTSNDPRELWKLINESAYSDFSRRIIR